MLKSLFIKNYALIDKLQIDFEKGLNIITGETGAGKSIMLGALGLVMGKRADTKALFDDQQKCIIEVKFTTDDIDLKPFFNANDLDFEDELLIRREITPSGKTRAFINDTPCTLDILQKLTLQIIDIHQQFDTQDIQKAESQLKLIDTLAENKSIRHTYSLIYEESKSMQKKLSKLKEISLQAQKDLDYYSFQLNELEEANLENIDQNQLESELQILERAEEVKEAFTQLVFAFEESEFPIISSVNQVIKELQSIATLDVGYKNLQDRVVSVMEELKDITKESQTIADTTESNDEELFNIQDKLNKLYNLQKKHQVETLEELISLQSEIEIKVSQFTNIDEEINSLENSINQKEAELLKLGKEITQSRQNIVPAFKSKIENLLNQLAMNNAKIEVQFKPLNKPGSNGLDQIDFLFAANKGSQLLPLKSVASGGETSRLALCIKSVLASKSELPTMIFDEIDTGVSGEVAQKMGNILLDLSNKHQVVTITHSPQIAAKATQHFYVYKEDTPEKTISKIKVLNHEGKVMEIAKMISGDPPSESAMEAAKELITA